jgi:hypothetical protein
MKFAEMRRICERMDRVLGDERSDWDQLADCATALLIIAFRLERLADDAVWGYDRVQERFAGALETMSGALNWVVEEGHDAPRERVIEQLQRARRSGLTALDVVEAPEEAAEG